MKRFFIDIITRDIDLGAAIMDLVDNSVDSARKLRGDTSLEGLSVSIQADEKQFSIEDNCGGIPVHHAKGYVFRMGRPGTAASTGGMIGQFGVGLKRALFKLGTDFIVDSTTDSTSFSVELDVTKWEKESDWGFDIRVRDSIKGSARGTTIVVANLYPDIALQFQDQSVIDDLRDDLTSRHRIAISNGLTINLNGSPLAGAPSEVAGGDLIQAATETFTIKTPEGGLVRVRVVAGVAPTQNDLDEDAEPEAVPFPASEAGWYVFGNGRLLLSAEKTRLTGWGGRRGVGLPLYHNQYARFRGFVFMDSNDSSTIPWNTMKTGVDQSDEVWVRTKQAMMSAGRQIITMLNLLKIERQAGVSGPLAPISTALSSSKMVAVATSEDAEYSISILELRADVVTAASYPAPNPELGEGVTRIAYTVDIRDFAVVSDALDEKRASRVGRLTFENYYTEVAD
ncbi:hypothetical protein B7495_12665 [Cryobacterium sp. LW097]|uniref:ATP-binding protein n=1 Tax=Cryobacterium sp. LW097 TaxID=1978566 RepID=UPI000B4DC386|nr:ATP-binding protein [Cryobacterium sp. LW097]ASD22836.1 hypothetical protein B7495_12665 [Cryobacterium sp. LW097]